MVLFLDCLNSSNFLCVHSYTIKGTLITLTLNKYFILNLDNQVPPPQKKKIPPSSKVP